MMEKAIFKISKTSIPNTRKCDFQIMDNRDSKIPEMRFLNFCFGFRNLLPRAPGFRSGAALLIRHTPPHLRAEHEIDMPPMDAVGWHCIVVLDLPWHPDAVLKNSKFVNLGHQKTIKRSGWFDAVLAILHGAISRSIHWAKPRQKNAHAQPVARPGFGRFFLAQCVLVFLGNSCRPGRSIPNVRYARQALLVSKGIIRSPPSGRDLRKKKIFLGSF